MFTLGKLSLIITTRCNLRCKLCCEYVPQNKPFPDMTPDEERRILAAAFEVCDHIETLHLTGGGEPFLHRKLAEMIEIAMEYSDRFDKLMLFTNCTVPLDPEVLSTLIGHREKIFIQLSRYGLKPEREEEFVQAIQSAGIANRVRKYYDDDQSFGGWVDFGEWSPHNKTPDELKEVFSHCSVTEILRGNWRTRDGKVHWCSRSQRGHELGLLPDGVCTFVDLLDPSLCRDEKRAAFKKIENSEYLLVCDWCSGDQGTDIQAKRYKAAEQEIC